MNRLLRTTCFAAAVASVATGGNRNAIPKRLTGQQVIVLTPDIDRGV